MSTPFDFINSVSESSDNQILTGELDPNEYNAFMVNRGLSLHMDTILLADEMNMRPSIPPSCQYHFLHTLVSKRKRWSKWPKKLSGKNDQEVLNTLQKYHKLSLDKSLEMIKFLSEDQKKEIIKEFEIPVNSKKRK
jgi:hypothetical protein